jgi:non-heme Fe2+,alpha-ketoglutarate-dependent halogenase
MHYRLSADQQAFFRANGYLTGLPPVCTAAEIGALNGGLAELVKLLRPGETAKDIREWHEESLWLYEICRNPRILDLVEGILGPDFYLWASNFFIKEAHSPQIVGWHQDAYYWPMAPHHSVTVWLAFTDADRDNGAMQVIPGSHVGGVIRHRRTGQTDSVLTLELERGSFREDTAVSLELMAGHCSLHDDRAIHGSPGNPSGRRRVGLAIRYSGTDVRNDPGVNPHFKTYLCRGEDRHRLNPIGPVPASRFGRPSFKPVSIEEYTAGDVT